MKRGSKTIFSVLIFWTLFWLLLFALSAFPQFFSHGLNTLGISCLLVGVSLVLVFLFLKHENRTFSEIGFSWDYEARVQLLLGTFAGIVVVGFMIFVMTKISAVSIEPVANPNIWDAIGYAAIILLVLALMEEIVFRSYPLFILAEGVGVRASIYVTSIFFAFYHGFDPTNLLGPGVWGLFFGFAAVWTKGLALPLGFHFGLNWMQSLFGLKLQYASSLWTLVQGDKGAILTTDVVGLLFQLILLIIGLTLIEIFVRKRTV